METDIYMDGSFNLRVTLVYVYMNDNEKYKTPTTNGRDIVHWIDNMIAQADIC